MIAFTPLQGAVDEECQLAIRQHDGKGKIAKTAIEDINNRIKVIKRMIRGLRDTEYFFLKIRAAFPGNLR
ncbi:MAG TPA: hypothetical protein ENK50_00600 [Sedimenticola sp.]|nr:hypothetical protein [Sedimenticola sp.]